MAAGNAGALSGGLHGNAAATTGATVGDSDVTTVAIKVTDVKGRTVEIPAPAKKLLIDDGRFLIALSLLHADPVSMIAAWPRDTARIGEQLWSGYRKQFPRLAGLPAIPSSAAPFSLERVISVRPDVAVFSLGHGPSDTEIRQLERAGIAVVFIDFFRSPLANLESSVKLLGAITGAEKRASEFVAYRKQHLDRIQKVLSSNVSVERPAVLLEAHAGISPECCFAPGKGNIGDYLTVAGGKNIGAQVIPGASGRLHIEYIISQNPSVYIATGGAHLEKAGGVVVGPGYTEAQTRASLQRMTSRSGFDRLRAVRDKRVHALSHQLLNSPLDIVALEVLATWLHPALFSDVNPEQTLKELNERFLAVPLTGTWWSSVK